MLFTLPGENRTSLKSRSYAPERSIAFSADAVAALGEQGKTVQDISLQLRRELESIAYLGPLRNKPRRTYIWNRTRPGIIGDDGSNAIPALLASAHANKKNGDDLVASVSKWLKKMKIAEKLEVKQLSAAITAYLFTEMEWLPISEMWVLVYRRFYRY